MMSGVPFYPISFPPLLSHDYSDVDGYSSFLFLYFAQFARTAAKEGGISGMIRYHSAFPASSFFFILLSLIVSAYLYRQTDTSRESKLARRARRLPG